MHGNAVGFPRSASSDTFERIMVAQDSSNAQKVESPSASADAPCTDTGVHSLVGVKVDEKYQVLERLGSGGMGAVYKAEHSLMGRIVALKVLHPHMVEREDLLKRFHHEARITSRLNHPNAVETYDFGVWRGAPYLVMEFVEGRTLKERVAASGPLSTAEVKPIFLQVCSALAKAHELGIIHRDLKPDNIMLTPEPDGSITARVLDFGIAKVLSGGKDSEEAVKTQLGSFFGTPKYASPEQILGKELDGRSDVYEIGIVLYEVLSGQIPFDAPSMMEVIIRQLNEKPVPLRKFKPELNISEEMEAIVTKCLEKDPDQRFRSANELREAIARIPLEPRRRFRASLVLAPATLAACAAGLVWHFTSSPKTLISRMSPSEQRGELADLANLDPIAPGALHEAAREDAVPKEPASAEEPKRGRNPLLALALGQILRSMSKPETAPAPETSEIDVPPIVFDPELSASPPKEDPIPQAAQPPAPPPPPPVELAMKEDFKTLEDGKKEAMRLYTAGRNLMRQKRYAEAAVKFEQAIGHRSDAVASYISLGNCSLRLNRNEQARAAFLSAVRIEPSYGPAHYNLAAFYALTGDSSSALTSLETAVRLDPKARRLAADEPDFASIRRLPQFQNIIGRR